MTAIHISRINFNVICRMQAKIIQHQSQNYCMNRTHHPASYQPSQLHHRGDLSPIRPRQKMPTIYRHRRVPQQPRQDGPQWPKDNSYLRKRIDRDVLLERSEMLMKTGRTSEDNPEWMTVNLNSYRKSNYTSAPKHYYREERLFDVFNNPKQLFNGRNEDLYFMKMQGANPQLPPCTDLSILRKTLQHSQLLHGQVAGKVGSTNERDYTIFRPQLKVGSNQFVDTYSPF